MGSVMDINKLYQYITTFNLINITIKNIAINTGRLWRRPVLGQSEIVCTVAMLDVQGDTAISLCRKHSLARRHALAFRRGALGRAHIVLATWTQVPYGFRKVHIRVPYGPVGMAYRLGSTHTICRAGCTEPASGLYEARESPFEAHL